jgi:hypothetical protein
MTYDEYRAHADWAIARIQANLNNVRIVHAEATRTYIQDGLDSEIQTATHRLQLQLAKALTAASALHLAVGTCQHRAETRKERS